MVNQIKNDSYMTTTIVLFDNVTRKVASQGGFFYGVVIIFFGFRAWQAFFTKLATPLRNAGFRYPILSGDAFVGTTFFFMKTYYFFLNSGV